MNEWQAGVVILTLCVVIYLIGCLHGSAWQRRQCEAEDERLRRIDPPDRPAGLPTNVGAEPSTPRQPKWRSGTFKSGPPHTG